MQIIFSPSVYQHYNQFKFIHRGTVNNKLLNKMNMVALDRCLYCKEHIETIEHIYLQRDNVKRLWKDTINVGEKYIRLSCYYILL